MFRDLMTIGMASILAPAIIYAGDWFEAVMMATVLAMLLAMRFLGEGDL